MFTWLNKNNFINNNEIPRTHTLMSGGIIGIPEENYGTFLELYAKEVKMNHKSLTFSEMRSDPVFKMYFDVDILDHLVLGKDFALQMTKVIQNVVSSYYPIDLREKEVFQCVVCSTKHKDVNIDGVDLIKNGFHIIMPYLLVNLEKSLQMRHTIVVELEKTMGKRPEDCNIWSDVIDRAVYANGLKMCGSVKKVRCSKCKKQQDNYQESKKVIMDEIIALRKKICPRKEEFNYGDISDIHPDEYKDSEFGRLRSNYIELTGYNSCPICHNTGRHLEDRMYMPTFVLDAGGEIEESLTAQLSRETNEAIKMTSIRAMSSDDNTPGYNLPKGVPIAPTETSSANLRNMGTKMIKFGNRIHKEVVNGDMFLADATEICCWTGPEMLDPIKLEAITKLLQTSVCNIYSSIHVKNVFESNIAIPNKGKNSVCSKMIASIANHNNGPVNKRVEIKVFRRFLVRVTGRGSDHCMNKGDSHTNNSIYFLITPDYCHQMCFSRKDDIRSGGNTTCGKYKSNGVTISPMLGKLLFEEEQHDVERNGPPKKKNKWDNLIVD